MNLDDLERLARAATPGPWEANIYDDDRQRTIATVATVEGWVIGPDCGSARLSYDNHACAMNDAAFIAAANPAAILRLVEIARAAQEFAGACDALDASLHNSAGGNDDAVQFRHDTAWAALRSALEGLKGSTP